MPSPNFTFVSTGIGKLLKDERLAVPPNQRPYKWEENHVRNMLEDFNDAITNDFSDYFMGTIVLVQKGTETPTIADGQQRLATVSILLARIRDQLRKISREKSAASIDNDFLRSIDRETEATTPRLKLNLEDHEFFVRSILPAPTEEEYNNRLPPARPSNKRLQAASDLINTYLEDLLKTLRPDTHAAQLLRWAAFIETTASLVLVKVPDEVGAYRIFETLNDRGLKASQADILKNFFFSKATSRLTEAQMMWNTISVGVETLGGGDADSLVTYIRHLWITTHGPTRERELAAQIKSEIGGETKTMKFLSDASIVVHDYVALSNPRHAKWTPYSATVRKNIEIISQHLRVEQIKPLMFAVATHFDPAEAEKAFKLFVSWSVRFLIYGGRGGMLDHQYSLRAQDVGLRRITKARDLRDAMKKYVPSDQEFEEAFASARVSRSHLARYYLRALEKSRTADPQPEYVANDEVEDVNLEHILPLEPSGNWKVDEETADAAQKRIGNMVLLKADQNRDIANAPFAEKKAVYGMSGYYLTKEVARNDMWGMEQIKARQAELAKLAAKTWSLDFSD